ncbi:hypothetical protein E4J89_14310 [Arthrobacter sp. CAU 1506]|uniref:cadherin-like beta sandwich domain-containing protein n=1 Tax=Arthrobacter sp. CAU 1506 TaxID=2560052 RepID=UPI0010ABEE59|nr:cadherin-like beta sandwich domain-containing protein [Arthrobacter sp. CAU 1506]TJY67464.1 hypothetical protein E4J89_14310 [Arthrobacter sp. CAU 1506]
MNTRWGKIGLIALAAMIMGSLAAFAIWATEPGNMTALASTQKPTAPAKPTSRSTATATITISTPTPNETASHAPELIAAPPPAAPERPERQPEWPQYEPSPMPDLGYYYPEPTPQQQEEEVFCPSGPVLATLERVTITPADEPGHHHVTIRGSFGNGATGSVYMPLEPRISVIGIDSDGRTVSHGSYGGAWVDYTTAPGEIRPDEIEVESGGFRTFTDEFIVTQKQFDRITHWTMSPYLGTVFFADIYANCEWSAIVEPFGDPLPAH